MGEMTPRQLRDFVRVVMDLQREMGCSMEHARETAAQMLMVVPPSPDEFNRSLNSPVRRRGRGRVKDGALTKSEAVAVVAVYFESIGAGREQAITEAKRWLGVSLSRRVAKSAVEFFKANTALSPVPLEDQFKLQALFAYAKFRQSAVPLPESMPKVRRRRRPTIRDLG
jgi:hypothetical protein